jgi:protein-S-isoprenylcysteine O-methyltransferase Ste14
LKGAGYIISIVSVLLLGTVAWNAVANQPLMRWCLIGGMVTSIIGMALRYSAHRRDRRELKRLS